MGELPDYASVNLGEPDAPAVMELLRQRGVGIEAGLATVADAERLVALDKGHCVLRILIEVDEQAADKAWDVADAIEAVLERARVRRSILLHSLDAMMWTFVERAARRRWSTRIGLDDGRELPDGTLATGNVALVAAAVEVFQKHARRR